MRFDKDKLKALREKRGLSIVEMSSRLVMSHQQYSKIEHDGNVSLKTVNRLAAALGVPGKSLLVE